MCTCIPFALDQLPFPYVFCITLIPRRTSACAFLHLFMTVTWGLLHSWDLTNRFHSSPTNNKIYGIRSSYFSGTTAHVNSTQKCRRQVTLQICIRKAHYGNATFCLYIRVSWSVCLVVSGRKPLELELWNSTWNNDRIGWPYLSVSTLQEIKDIQTRKNLRVFSAWRTPNGIMKL